MARPTTSATGKVRGRVGRVVPNAPAAAFTLLEILLVIALIGLLATLTIGGATRLLRRGDTSPDEVFAKACQTARKTALSSGNSVRLSYDDKAKAFICDDGLAPQSIPIPNPPPDLAIDFHNNQSTGNNVMIVGGTIEEIQPVAYVTFYADGTCTPFNVQFRAKGGAHRVTIDGWTCAPMLNPKPAT